VEQVTVNFVQPDARRRGFVGNAERASDAEAVVRPGTSTRPFTFFNSLRLVEFGTHGFQRLPIPNAGIELQLQ